MEQMKFLVIFVVLITLCGCATYGGNFSSFHVREIKVGKTTDSQVYDMFGDPYTKGLEDGERTWVYRYVKYNLFGGKYNKELSVKLDKKGVVKSYTYENNFPGEEVD